MDLIAKNRKIQSIHDLDVYRLAYEAAMEIYKLTKQFPAEEKYSLTDQIRKSSRSVAINIREGFAKKRYPNVFIRHCNDAAGSSEETRGWLQFAFDCTYLNESVYKQIDQKYDRINAMLYRMMENWTTIENIDNKNESIN